PSLALYWKEVVLDADSFSPPASPEGSCMTQPMKAGDKRGSGASPDWWRRNLPAMRTALAAYAGITVGVTLVALGLNWFLVPNRLAAGGVSGLAVVIYDLFNIPVGATMLVINIPLFALAAKVLGGAARARSIFGFVALSVITDGLAAYLQPLTRDPVLAAIDGGVLVGIGVGITYRLGGSTGGTALGARLIDPYLRIGTGRAMLLADGLVILAAGLAFGPALALYALLGSEERRVGHAWRC